MAFWDRKLQLSRRRRELSHRASARSFPMSKLSIQVKNKGIFSWISHRICESKERVISFKGKVIFHISDYESMQTTKYFQIPTHVSDNHVNYFTQLQQPNY